MIKRSILSFCAISATYGVLYANDTLCDQEKRFIHIKNYSSGPIKFIKADKQESIIEPNSNGFSFSVTKGTTLVKEILAIIPQINGKDGENLFATTVRIDKESFEKGNEFYEGLKYPITQTPLSEQWTVQIEPKGRAWDYNVNDNCERQDGLIVHEPLMLNFRTCQDISL